MDLNLGNRKLQQSTSGTYLVALPVEWVRTLGLGKGDFVSITVTEEGLILKQNKP